MDLLSAATITDDEDKVEEKKEYESIVPELESLKELLDSKEMVESCKELLSDGLVSESIVGEITDMLGEDILPTMIIKTCTKKPTRTNYINVSRSIKKHEDMLNERINELQELIENKVNDFKDSIAKDDIMANIDYAVMRINVDVVDDILQRYNISKKMLEDRINSCDGLISELNGIFISELCVSDMVFYYNGVDEDKPYTENTLLDSLYQLSQEDRALLNDIIYCIDKNIPFSEINIDDHYPPILNKQIFTLLFHVDRLAALMSSIHNYMDSMKSPNGNLIPNTYPVDQGLMQTLVRLDKVFNGLTLLSTNFDPIANYMVDTLRRMYSD